MEIKKIGLNSINNLVKDDEKLIVTIGAFDGIHIGHQRLLLALNEEKKKDSFNRIAVLTFEKHPDFYLNKRDEELIIENNKNKYEEFLLYNVDYIFLMEKELLPLSYKEFHRLVLDKINTKMVIVGKEFRYGYKALGNVKTLEEDYLVKTFLVVKNNGEKISSTEIRDLLKAGNVEEAAKLLGHNYFIELENFDIKEEDDSLIISGLCDNIISKEGVYDCNLYINNQLVKDINVNVNFERNNKKYGITVIIDRNFRCEINRIKIEFLKNIDK